MNIDPPVMAALVTGTCAVIGPILTFVFTKRYENRIFQPMSPSRIKAIEGNWVGKAVQVSGIPIEATVSLQLRVVKKKVLGTSTFLISHNNIENVQTFECVGGFLHQRFLRLEYNPDKNQGTRLGGVVLELIDNDETLKGGYVGYGAYSGEIVTGTLRLRKKL